MRLPGRDGTRRPVHPVVFHRALELVDAAGWQVRQDQDELTMLVASLGPAFDAPAVQQAIPLGWRMLRSPRWPSALWSWKRYQPVLRANAR